MGDGAGSVLVMAAVLWMMWRREGRKAGKNMSGALGIPLVMVVLAGAGYGLIGLNEHTPTWLEHKQNTVTWPGRLLLASRRRRRPRKCPPAPGAGAAVRTLASALAVGWYALGALYDQLGAPVQTEEAARKACS